MASGDPPIFVVGYQRSGTTLLQSLIGAHPQIAAPPELHFILRVAYLRTVFGDLADDRNLRRALHEALNPPVDLLSQAGFEEDVIFERARSGPRTYAGLFAAIMQDYADRQGKRRWSEKSPSQKLDDIYSLFPDALAVHILRDAREIVASNLEMPWERRSSAAIARAVRNFTLASIKRGRKAGPGRYMQVRYEDLTSETESVLRQVCVFVGEEYDDGILDPARRGSALSRGADWQRGAAEPVVAPRAMNWPRRLTRIDQVRVQALTRDLLEPFGYKAPSRPVRMLSPLTRAEMALRFAIPDMYARSRQPKTPQARYEAIQKMVMDASQTLTPIGETVGNEALRKGNLSDLRVHHQAGGSRTFQPRHTGQPVDMADVRQQEEGVRDEKSVGDGLPDKPGELDKSSWWQAIKRTVKEFKEDNLTDWAAALTYYGVLSVFPAILALVSILGLLGSGTTQTLIDNLGQVAPGPAQEIFTSAIENLQKNQGAAGIMVDRRARARDLVGVRVRGGVHARVERDLRRRGGAADLEEPSHARWHDPGPARAAGDHRRWRRPHRRPGGAGREGARDRQDRSGRLEHREVAGPDRDRQLHVRVPLLGGAEREASEVPLGQPGRRRRGADLDRRVARVRLLRGQLRLLQQDLRLARRRNRLPDVALDHEHRRPARRRARTRSSSAAARSRAGCARTASPSSSLATHRPRFCLRLGRESPSGGMDAPTTS